MAQKLQMHKFKKKKKKFMKHKKPIIHQKNTTKGQKTIPENSTTTAAVWVKHSATERRMG